MPEPTAASRLRYYYTLGVTDTPYPSLPSPELRLSIRPAVGREDRLRLRGIWRITATEITPGAIPGEQLTLILQWAPALTATARRAPLRVFASSLDEYVVTYTRPKDRAPLVPFIPPREMPRWNWRVQSWIEFTRANTPPEPPMSEAEYTARGYRVLGRIPSRSNPNREPYVVAQNPATSEISCNCPGWINSKASPKTCRHVTAFRVMLSQAGPSELRDQLVASLDARRNRARPSVGQDITGDPNSPLPRPGESSPPILNPMPIIIESLTQLAEALTTGALTTPPGTNQDELKRLLELATGKSATPKTPAPGTPAASRKITFDD